MVRAQESSAFDSRDFLGRLGWSGELRATPIDDGPPQGIVDRLRLGKSDAERPTPTDGTRHTLPTPTGQLGHRRTGLGANFWISFDRTKSTRRTSERSSGKSSAGRAWFDPRSSRIADQSVPNRRRPGTSRAESGRGNASSVVVTTSDNNRVSHNGISDNRGSNDRSGPAGSASIGPQTIAASADQLRHTRHDGQPRILMAIGSAAQTEKPSSSRFAWSSPTSRKTR